MIVFRYTGDSSGRNLPLIDALANIPLPLVGAQRIPVLRSLESTQEAFQTVHLPAEQLVEVVEQLERLLGSVHIATALLLKGSGDCRSGTLGDCQAEQTMHSLYR
jgi:hypothetical protein